MRDTRVLSVGNMHSRSPLCPNCSRPMVVARTILGLLDEPDVNVFECRRCRVDFITEDHLTIAETALPSFWGERFWLQKVSQMSGWKPIATAAMDVELELCAYDSEEYHALVFPCRRNGVGWSDVRANRMVPIRPTHWRLWSREPA